MRYELTDQEWSAIKLMLPNKPRGVPRVNDRRMLNGIFSVLHREHHGTISRVASVHTPPATSALCAGEGLVSANGLWMFSLLPMATLFK